MQAIILAGGLGTRLGSITKNIPKAMVNIKEKPFLEYLIVWLKKFEIKNIILCIGYKGNIVRNYFMDGGWLGVTIDYAVESVSNLLGTAGAIKHAEKLIKCNNFIVMNGDSFVDVNLSQMIDFHLQKGAIATIAVVNVCNASRYGAIELDNNANILNFVEKGKKGANLINSGVYVLNRKLLKYIPANKNISLEKDIFPKLVGNSLYGFLTEGYFIDIGTLKDLSTLLKHPETFVNLTIG